MCGEDADVRYEDSLYYKKASIVREMLDKLIKVVSKPCWFRRYLIRVLFPEVLEWIDEARDKIFWS